MTKRQKEEAKKRLPQYAISEEEQEWYEYCLNHDIRISPMGIKDRIGEWHIGVSDPTNYKKVYKSKFIYKADTIWKSFFEMCKYYYDKR